MPYFDQKAFEANLMAECEGKQLCYPSVKLTDYISLPADMQSENVLLFAQVGCSQTEETLMNKRSWGLAIVCIGIFMVIFFRITMRSVMVLDVCNEKIFDARLITANDFTVKIKVTKEMTDKFNESHAEHPEKDNTNIQLYEKDLTREIEKQLQEKLREEDSKIVDVQFGFNNAKMLAFLE